MGREWLRRARWALFGLLVPLAPTLAQSQDSAAQELLNGGRTTVVARDTLTNRGLIDGGQTRIDAGTLDNVGTGRIYGDRLAIKAGILNNREEANRAAVIAARQRLDIGASLINNREQALIFSADSGSDALNIGGTLDANHQASGRADLILNDSATIESLGGLTIDSHRLLNRNLHFSTELAQVGGATNHRLIQPKGDPNKHNADEYRWEKWSRAGRYRHNETRAEVAAWTEYDVTRTAYDTQVTESAPSMIRAGGNMTLRGDELVNDKSQIIAGGTLQGDLHNLKNEAALGEHITHETGTSRYTYSKWRGGTKRHHQRKWNKKIAYAPADIVQTVDLGISKVVQNAAGSGSGFTVDSRQTGQVNGSAGSSAGAADGAGQKQITEVQAVTQHVSGPATSEKTSVDRADDPGRQQGGKVDGASGDVPMVIRTIQVDTDVPANSLFRTGPNAGSYLVETDPRFADYRSWLTSDYLLSQLGYDPATLHKRLGDGFYEQKLVRDQIGQLTGRRFLDGYASDEAQYRALLEAGSTHGKAWNLRPGLALSAEQMAQLTSDIVWLVERDVTLADGTTTRALVPQVYVRVKPGDLDGRGTLIAANAVNLDLKGDLINAGTIAGRTAVKLTGENLRNLGGRITGDAVALTARNDIDNLGGVLDANSALLVKAGRDLNVVSTTRSDAKQAGLSDFSRTHLDRVAGLYVDKPAGTLVAIASRDVNLIAAQVSNSGKDGQTAIVAGRDLLLGTVKVAEQENNVLNSSNYLKQGYVQDVGTRINSTGDVRLQAGRGLTATAANVTSDKGALVALSQGDVNILAGEASSNWAEGRQHKSSSLLGARKKTTRDSLEETRAVSSIFSGDTLAVQGQNVTLTGSNVVSDTGTVIVAKSDLTIQAATETSSESHFKETKKRGVLSGAGIGFTVGKQMQSDDQKSVRTIAASSTVGSVSGDLNLAAGNQYRQIGSDVLAPEGDISVVAKNIEISEARQTERFERESKFKQTGLSVGITSPVISAVETTGRVVSATRKTDNGRMKALGAAMAGLNAYDAYRAGSNIANAMKNGRDPSKAAGVGINISVGSSKSESRTSQTTNTAHGSTVKAAGNVSLVATGAGQNSNILIRGSEVAAGKNAILIADNRVDLVAAENNEKMQSKNSNSSASVGVGINIGGDQNGITLNASGSKGRGKSTGEDNWYTNSSLKAGDTVLISSGGHTNVRGAEVAAHAVKLDVGGDLNIESLQDASTFESQDKTTGAGISVCVSGCARAPVSANVNIQKAKTTGNYASVVEQSGIRARDGGFDIRVKGNTDLKGALIASSQDAIDAGTNRLATASLTTGDIVNRSETTAKSSGISLSSDYLSQGKHGIGKTIIGNAINNGSASDSSRGLTQTAVSKGTVRITDESKQKALTGIDAETTVADLNRDTVNAHVAAKKINIKELEQQARAEQVIRTAVAAQAFKFSDDAYRTMFLDKHKVFRAEQDDKGDVIFDKEGHAELVELSAEEKANMQAGAGGQVRVGINGIFNDADAAARYAGQHNGRKVTPLYIVAFPPADSTVGELMVAGYQHFLESNFWGLTNSGQEVKDLMKRYGTDGLVLDAHSRGSLTVGNALESLMDEGGNKGLLINTDINLYGPPYGAQKAADYLYKLSLGVKDRINLQNHADDFVGSIIGGNPATHSGLPENSNKVKEWIRMFSEPETVHSCYGAARDACTNRYGEAKTLEIKARIGR